MPTANDYERFSWQKANVILIVLVLITPVIEHTICSIRYVHNHCTGVFYTKEEDFMENECRVRHCRIQGHIIGIYLFKIWKNNMTTEAYIVTFLITYTMNKTFYFRL